MRLAAVCLVALLAGIVACQERPVPAGPSTSGFGAASPVIAVSSPQPVETAPSFVRGMVAAQVVNVVDGDTIDVLLDGRQYRVRYIGIDTPETVHPTRGVEPGGIEASDRNKRLVAGKTVHLEKDVSETDQYGRLLRYVWLDDGTMVNAALVEEGYAQVATYPPDVRYQERFLALQREARDGGRGLWGARAAPDTTASELGASAGTLGDVPGATLYDPAGPDRDCGDFPTWRDAQAFYEAAGGPGRDPHRLDGDRDGVACESLSGAP